MVRKLFATFIVVSTGFVCSYAQSKFNVSGTVIEEGTNGVIESATVQILSLPDSTYLKGAATNEVGSFTIESVNKGNYALKISFIGYESRVMKLDLTKEKKKNVDVGYITLKSDAVLLKSAEVTANAAKVQVSGDSLIYNASAYRVPEGSALEELVKKLPGAKVDDEGNITINGKSVSKIMLNGKEFFLNDTKTAMQNLPVDIIEKVKTYERKSDMARVTGIDDGQEETVLDLTVKKGMSQGWFGNINLGAGTENRYSNRLYVQRISDHSQLSIIGNANNVGDRGFGGGGGRGWGRGGGGLRSSKRIGLSFASEFGKVEMGGSVNYSYNGSDNSSISSSQNFVTPTGAFDESKSKSLSSNSSISADFRLEWEPDSFTSIIFRPNGSYSRNRGMSGSTTATFNKDPNELSDDPLAEATEWANSEASLPDNLKPTSIDQQIKNIDSIIVNFNNNRSQTYSNNRSLNGSLQVNRRLSNNGRNLTLRANGGASGSDSEQLSAALIKYKADGRADTYNNRYYNTPGRSHNYSVQMTYSEPIADRTYLQLSYQYSYSYNKNDRQAFNYDNSFQAYSQLEEALRTNRYDIDAILDYVNDYTKNEELSQFSEYKNYNQNIQLQYRMVRDKFNFGIGAEALPQKTKLDYDYMNIDTVVTRNVFNITPTLDFRYNFDNMTNLHFTYRGRTSQPSMTNLLDITDDSNPLNITKGNPGLKPSFSNNFDLRFNTYNAEAQRGIFSWVGFGMTRNSISNMVRYDSATGVRTTRPENINGNWNANAGFGFNTGIGKDKAFTFSSNTNLGYNNQVGYHFDTDQQMEDLKNNITYSEDDRYVRKSKTRSLTLMENLEFGYRNDWFETSINGSINYSRNRNNIVENNDLDTYNFSYGADFSVYMPWGTRIVTDIAMNSRRGYAQKEMNTNELIWNAQVSHSFLKGNALTISLEVNDILAEQSNISRVVNAMMSSDSRNNSIYQYGILRIIYKLNIFGGKNSFGPGQGGRMGFGQGGFPPGGMMGGRSARGVGGAPAGGIGRMGGGGRR